MTCTHQERLVELVYGELGPQEAAELRGEVDACPRCAPELARLEEAKRLADMLPLEPLPNRTREAILAAAREAAEAADPAVHQPRVVPLRRSALWPAVAMAAVMLLVVVVGVSYSPEQQANELERMVPETPPSLERREPGAVEEPTSAAPAPSSAGSAAERSTPAQTQERPEPGLEAATPAPAEPPRARRRRRRRDATSTQMSSARSATERPTATLAARGTLPSAPTSAPAPAAAPPAGGALLAPRPTRARARPAAPAPSGSEGSDQAWGLRSEAPASRSLGNQTQAPAPETRASLPEVLLRLARNHRARGACPAAVSRYAELRRRYPTNPTVPQALLEEADCRRRLGQLTQARTLLREAAGYRRTEAVARLELRRVETQLGARRGAASSPAQAADPAQASE